MPERTVLTYAESRDLVQSTTTKNLPQTSKVAATAPVAKDAAVPVPPFVTAPIMQTVPLQVGDGPAASIFFKDPRINMVTLETPSAIMILNKATSAIQMQTTRFFLQSITKPQQEKFQVIETFGDPHIFFYGQRARMYTLNGVLLDGFYGMTPEGAQKLVSGKDAKNQAKQVANRNMWATAMQKFYQEELRGTVLQGRGTIAALYVNGWLIKGYPVNLTIMKEATQFPDGVTFQMSWIVEEEILLRGEDVKSSYSPIDKDNTLVPKLNTLYAAQQTYYDKLTFYNSIKDDPTVPPEKKTEAFKAIDTAVTAVQEAQKQVTTEMNKNSGKARKLLNMD